MAGFFSRLKGKDGSAKAKSKKQAHLDALASQLPQKPKWDDAYARKTVEPEEIQELVRRCTEELKARGMICTLFSSTVHCLLHPLRVACKSWY